jgi:hypothetical protein
MVANWIKLLNYKNMTITSIQKTDDGNYTLYQTVLATDVDGNPVSILESIGTFDLNDLNNRLQDAQQSVTDLQTMIDAINSFNNTGALTYPAQKAQ